MKALLLEFFECVVAHRSNAGFVLGDLQVDRVVLVQKLCKVGIRFLQAMHGIRKLRKFTIKGVWQEIRVHLGFLGWGIDDHNSNMSSACGYRRSASLTALK